MSFVSLEVVCLQWLQGTQDSIATLLNTCTQIVVRIILPALLLVNKYSTFFVGIEIQKIYINNVACRVWPTMVSSCKKAYFVSKNQQICNGQSTRNIHQSISIVHLYLSNLAQICYYFIKSKYNKWVDYFIILLIYSLFNLKFKIN